MPFVVFENDRFTVNPDAVEFLKTLGNKPLGVLALAGPYRHGKSFLLNRVILQNEPGTGFQVGQTVNACTKGLHISTKTLSSGNSSDGDYEILVVDTEGLGAMTATDTHDARIFSLALLLSSTFVYNSKGTIDQPAINNLSLVANLSDHIKTSSSDDLSNFLPSFLWVVRDFALDLVDQHGESMDEKTYLEQALQPVPGADPEKNKVRNTLRAYFRHRDCVTMVRPCDDEKMLKSLNSQPDAALKPEFTSQAKLLREKVLVQTRPKQACGTHVTGELLARLATVYCEAINKGAAPAIQDSWSLISADECAKAVLSAKEAFCAHLTKNKADGTMLDGKGDRVPVPSNKLEKLFSEGFELALAAYKKLSIGDRSEEFRNRLREQLRAESSRVRVENMAVIARKAEATCAVIDESLMEQTTFEDVRKMYTKLEASYVKQVGTDASCRSAWNEQAAKHVWDWASRFYADQTSRCAEATARVDVLSKQSELFSKQIEEARAATQKTEKDLAKIQEQLSASRAAEEDSSRKVAMFKQEMQQHMDEMDQLDERYRKQIQELQASLSESVAASEQEAQLKGDLELELSRAREQLEELRGSALAMAGELEELRGQRKQFAEQTQNITELEESVGNLRRRNEDLTALMDRDAEQHRQEILQLHTESKTTIEHLQAAKEEAQKRSRAALDAETKCKAELKSVRADLTARLDRQTKDAKRLQQSMEKVQAQYDTERSELKQELTDLRAEASKNVQKFQQQLEDNASQHREEMRKRNGKAREEQERLFQEKVSAVSRAQSAEARAKHSEDALKEARETLASEREKAREQNYAGRVSELESRLSTADTRNELLQSSMAEKSDLIAEQQSQITELEAELRQIQQRHEAEKMRIELDYARKLGSVGS